MFSPLNKKQIIEIICFGSISRNKRTFTDLDISIALDNKITITEDNPLNRHIFNI